MDACATVVVTYFPTQENIDHILNLKHRCGLLVIIDNTDADGLLTPVKSKNLVIVNNQTNIGLAAALNKGIKIAGQSGYDNIFLLDQDTIVNSDYFKEMLEFRSEYERKMTDKVLIVPNFLDQYSGTFARFPLLTTFNATLASCIDIATIQKKQSLIAITSGTHLTFATYQTIGPFRDDYFIDFIDHEYCLRAAINGYKVVPNCSTVIRHSIGKRSVHSLFDLTIKPTHHSALRKYYFSRNSIRTAITYLSTFPVYPLLVIAHITHELIASILYEKDSRLKVKAIGYGVLHGLLNKMGACKINLI